MSDIARSGLEKLAPSCQSTLRIMRMDSTAIRSCILCQRSMHLSGIDTPCADCWRKAKERKKSEERRKKLVEEAQRRGWHKWRPCFGCNKVKALRTEFKMGRSKAGREMKWAQRCKTCQDKGKASWHMRRKHKHSRKKPNTQAKKSQSRTMLRNGPPSIDQSTSHASADLHSNSARLCIQEPTMQLHDSLYSRCMDTLEQTAADMEAVISKTPEEHLNDRCHAGWKEYLRHYKHARDLGQRLIPRIATFAPAYVGERKSTLPVGDFEITNRHDTGGCKVLCATQEELEAAMKKGGIPSVSFILIPALTETSKVSANEQTKEFVNELRLTFPGFEMEYQNYVPSETSSLTAKMAVPEFLELYDAANASPQSFRPYAQGRHPYNFLNLSGGTVAPACEKPPVVNTLKLRLLDKLMNAFRHQSPSSDGIGKAVLREHTLADSDECKDFHLIAEPGAVSSWHMDVVGATWVQCLSGRKGWGMYDGPDSSEIWTAFAANAETGGISWKPPVGTLKTIPLMEGDILVMMPGKFTAHFPVTHGNTFTHMRGGQVWQDDPDSLGGLLSAQLYLIKHNAVVTNEPVPRLFADMFIQLQKYIDKVLALRTSPNCSSLPKYDERHQNLVQDFIKSAKPFLSCVCKDAHCEQGQSTVKKRGNQQAPILKCPCYERSGSANRTVRHEGGCTAFCHGGKHLDERTRACKPVKRRKKRKG